MLMQCVSVGIPGSGSLQLQVTETWENAETGDVLQEMCKHQGFLSCSWPESILFLPRECICCVDTNVLGLGGV